MDELMIPRSMHESAVEAARTFGKEEAERQAMTRIALLVEAAGGEIRLSRKGLMGDPPDIFASEEFATNEVVYRTRRRSQSATNSPASMESGSDASPRQPEDSKRSPSTRRPPKP